MIVVDLNPKQAQAWLKLGIIYMRFFSEYYRARDCFNKAIEQGTNSIVIPFSV